MSVIISLEPINRCKGDNSFSNIKLSVSHTSQSMLKKSLLASVNNANDHVIFLMGRNKKKSVTIILFKFYLFKKHLRLVEFLKLFKKLACNFFVVGYKKDHFFFF